VSMDECGCPTDSVAQVVDHYRDQVVVFDQENSSKLKGVEVCHASGPFLEWDCKENYWLSGCSSDGQCIEVSNGELSHLIPKVGTTRALKSQLSDYSISAEGDYMIIQASYVSPSGKPSYDLSVRACPDLARCGN